MGSQAETRVWDGEKEEGERKERVGKRRRGEEEKGKRRGRRGGKEFNSQGDALSLPPTPVRQQLLWNTTRLANSALHHMCTSTESAHHIH